MNETNLVRKFLLTASRAGSRLWRQNSGQGWIGQSVKFTRRETVTVNPGDVLIRAARPFHAGFEGLSDMGGFTPRNGVAVYTAVEAKTERGTVTKEQRAFIQMVRSFGGLAGVARSDRDVERIIRGDVLD